MCMRLLSFSLYTFDMRKLAMPLSIHKDHICAGNELHSHIDICYNVLYPNFMNLGVCVWGEGGYT